MIKLRIYISFVWSLLMTISYLILNIILKFDKFVSYGLYYNLIGWISFFFFFFIIGLIYEYIKFLLGFRYESDFKGEKDGNS